MLLQEMFTGEPAGREAVQKTEDAGDLSPKFLFPINPVG